MKIGVCLNMLRTDADPMGLRLLEASDDCGFDYVELPAAQMMDLSDAEFDALLTRLSKMRMKCEACNNMFPAHLRMTGDAPVPQNKIEEYLDGLFPRLAKLGAEVVVFGSSGAKNIPEGFSYETAFRQITGVMTLAAARSAKHGTRIAIEPLNRSETNITLNATDGARLMRAVNRPEVRVLVDYYHHELEHERAAPVVALGKDLIHTHFAEVTGRVMPSVPKPEYVAFIHTLRGAGYDGRVSVEAYSKNPIEDMKRAAKVMRGLIG